MRTVAFCESNPFCRQVLAERWPQIDCYHDVQELDATELVARYGPIDLICGGFPCQDISLAGKGAGLAGARSGLWVHFARIIRDVRPRWVVIENVSALRRRGLGTVLADLAALRYDAEWHCIPASYVGAPHQRDRLWIIAYAERDELRLEQQWVPRGWEGGIRHQGQAESPDNGAAEPLADTDRPGRATGRHERPPRDEPHRGGAVLANATGEGFQERTPAERRGADRGEERGQLIGESWWGVEPDVGRVADGVPDRVDRLESLGNAVVPDIPEMIGRAIMEMEK